MIDYIFYRIYKGQVKSKNPPLMGTMLFFCIVLLPFFSPFVSLTIYLFAMEGLCSDIFFWSCYMILFIIIYIRFFYKKKYLKIISKYQQIDKYKFIPLFFIELLYFISILFAIFGLKLVNMIVEKYSLNGKLLLFIKNVLTV
jgi:hypothetical protein